MSGSIEFGSNPVCLDVDSLNTLIASIADWSFLSHSDLGSLESDDHTQYFNVTRGDARYLAKANTDAFTPDADYEPATKKYVDDHLSSGSGSYWTKTGVDIYYNNGKVGINDSAPDYLLDVNGDSRFIDAIRADAGIKDDSFFSAGFLGAGYSLWEDDGKYSLELDNLKVRGRMDIFELVVNKYRAVNGVLWVTDVNETYESEDDSITTGLHEVSTTLTGTVAVTNSNVAVVGTSTLFSSELAVGDEIKIGTLRFIIDTITDNTHLNLKAAYGGSTDSGITAYKKQYYFNTGKEGASFMVNDLIVAQKFTAPNVTRFEYIVKSIIVETNYYKVYVGNPDITLILEEPTDDLTGQTFIRFGNTTNDQRQGSLLLDANDDDNPYMDIYDGVDSFTTSFDNIKVRIGNLEGIAEQGNIPADPGYGLYSDNVYLTGEMIITGGSTHDDIVDAAANATAALNGVVVDANGKIDFIASPTGDGFYVSATHLGYYADGVWKTYMQNNGDFFLGGAGGALQWSSGVLTIEGSITLTNTIPVGKVSGTDAYTTDQDMQSLSSLNYDTPGAGTGLYMDATHLGYYKVDTWLTYMDNTGNFYLGGTDGALRWNSDADTLYIEGEIVILSGTTKDLLDSKTKTFRQAETPTATAVGDLWYDTDDGYKLYIANATGTGGWVLTQDADIAAAQDTADDNAALIPNDARGLINLPYLAPNSSGLYLNESYLGYWDDADGWMAYMASNGDFKLGSPANDGYVVWSSNTGTLTVKGIINATSGTIGGWTIDSDSIYHGTEHTTDGYSTDGITLHDDGSIHAENFYINADGTPGMKGLDSLGTGGGAGRVSIKYNAIWGNDNIASDTSGVGINYYSYDEGTAYLRYMNVYNGKGIPTLTSGGDGTSGDNFTKIHGTFIADAGIRLNVYRATYSYTILSTQYIILCDNSVSDITVKLPSVANAKDGETHVIKRGNTKNVTLEVADGSNMYFNTSVTTTNLDSGRAYTMVYSATYGKWACIGKYSG